MIRAKTNWTVIVYALLIGLTSAVTMVAVDWMSCRDEHPDFKTWLSQFAHLQK